MTSVDVVELQRQTILNLEKVVKQTSINYSKLIDQHSNLTYVINRLLVADHLPNLIDEKLLTLLKETVDKYEDGERELKSRT